MEKHLVFAVINDLSYDQRMIRICNSLAKSGYQVTLVGRQLSESLPLQEQSFFQKRMQCWFRSGPIFYLEYNIRLFFHLLVNNYDVFGACDLDTALATHLAGRLKRKKRIFDAHEFFTEVPEVMNRSFVKSVWKRIGQWTIPKFHLRYTVNQALAEKLEEVYGVGFGVVRNLPEEGERNPPALKLRRAERGVGNEEQAEQPTPKLRRSEEVWSQKRGAGKQKSQFENKESKEKIILYQGALNAGRGLEQIIDAMPMIDGAKLWLVGDGDLNAALRERCTSLDLDDKVLFWGKKTPAELKKITPLATIGLNLLDEASLNYYYSLANKFFDYMQDGIPSINMCFPAYEKILKDHFIGICIDSLHPDQLAVTINELFANSERIEQMKSNCATAIDLFRWENEQEELLSLIHQLA
jgi:glycosyltransferase involved in cell wall biosynthesis